MRCKVLLWLFLVVFVPCGISAQDFAVKTNLLYDATATINLGAEYKLAPKWTVDLSGNYNNWNFSHGRRWKHWFLQPEARYWLCESFGGHFLGLHMQGGKFNIGNLDNGLAFLGTHFSKLSDERYQGWFLGMGLGYGYSWILNRHWNVEAELGFGYNFTKSDRYPCADCGDKIESGKKHHYMGPTKAALNLVYQF